MRLGDRRLADAERLRRNRDAAALQRPHREAEALIDRAEHLIVADVDVELEVHAAEPANAERIGAGRARDAGRVHRHEKRGDALPAQSGPRAREDDRHRCRVGVGDPDLAAGDADSRRPSCTAASSGSRRRCRRLAPTARTRRSPRRTPAGAATAPSASRRPAWAISSATSELVTTSDTATVALARGNRLDRQRVAQVVEPGAAPLLGNRGAAAGRAPPAARIDVERKLARSRRSPPRAARRPRARTARSTA